MRVASFSHPDLKPSPLRQHGKSHPRETELLSKQTHNLSTQIFGIPSRKRPVSCLIVLYSNSHPRISTCSQDFWPSPTASLLNRKWQLKLADILEKPQTGRSNLNLNKLRKKGKGGGERKQVTEGLEKQTNKNMLKTLWKRCP